MYKTDYNVAMCFRITDQRHERLPYFVFGDFNFRLDSKQVIEVSGAPVYRQPVRYGDIGAQRYAKIHMWVSHETHSNVCV